MDDNGNESVEEN